MNNFTEDKLVFEYLPHDLQKQLGEPFVALKNEIIEKIKKSKIFDQNYLELKQIMIYLEKNHHQGDSTYMCKINLDCSNPNFNFVHTEEGKDYLRNIRNAIEVLIEYVFHQKEKLESKSKSSQNNSF